MPLKHLEEALQRQITSPVDAWYQLWRLPAYPWHKTLDRMPAQYLPCLQIWTSCATVTAGSSRQSTTCGSPVVAP